MSEKHTAEKDAPIGNPSNVPPVGWDMSHDAETEPEWRFGAPMPRTELSCGCYLRRPDYEAVLCPEHLAELNGSTRVFPPGSTTDTARVRAARDTIEEDA